MADKRVEVEDDLVFLASDLSTASRQFNAMKPGCKKKLSYKKFSGMDIVDVREYLMSCCLKMLYKVCFLCYVSGIDDIKMKRVVDRASADGIKYNMVIH